MTKGKKHSKRWLILPLEISRKGQVLHIEHRIPAYLRLCCGVHMTVKGKIPDMESEIPHLGELSLQFNNGKQHPLHFMAGYSPRFTKNLPTTLKLEETLLAHHSVTGFYRDNKQTINRERSFQPYQLNIYFECKT